MMSTKQCLEPGANPEELALVLTRANTLLSVSEAVSAYCGRLLGASAGILFVENTADRHLVPILRPRQTSIDNLPPEVINKSPIARTFRTGIPFVWHAKRIHHATVFRPLCRALSPRSSSIALLPIQLHRETPVGVLAMALPVPKTEIRVMHEQLAPIQNIVSFSIIRAREYDEAVAARAAAENALRHKDELFSVISHELKNPMMPILGWAVALSSGNLAPEKQTVALDGIIRNVRALNYLVEDLFDSARIASGKLRLQRSETRIQEVAHEVLTAIQPGAEAKKLRISTDIDGAIPSFFADPRRLRQALTNLLNNAVKFTPEGGMISIKVARRRDVVECVISDTGRGIKAGFMPLIFDKFSQDTDSLKNRSAGLGLGLAIVQEIAELHGGSITANSDGPDKGASFVLRLPFRTSCRRTS